MPLVIHKPEALPRLLKRDEIGPDDDVAAALIETLPPATLVDVSLKRYTPTELAFDVKCPDDGWLLITDRWARGWQARVDNKRTPVWGGNFIFRALPVKQGRQSIEFSYRPFGYPWIVIVSWCSLFAIFSISLYRFCRDT